MFSLAGGHGAAVLALHGACESHLRDFSEENPERFSAFFELESDLSQWFEVLSDRPETAQYLSAHRDLGLAFYSISTGLYRQAFGGLRSFIEVAFGAIHLSAAELERRRWVNGRRDLSWSEITSSETAIYSTQYLQEFCVDAQAESPDLLERLRSAYRRSSEYLHGNVVATALLPTSIEYRQQPVSEWSVAATAALRAFHHSLFVRYYADLQHDSQRKLDSLLEQHFHHLSSVRRALGLPIEGE